MFKVFKLDQTVLNERVWWSTGIQQNQTHQKNWNQSFEFWSQSNFEFGYQTKWNSHKENWNRTKSNFLILNFWWQVQCMLIHWSSVRAVKGILILVSFIISIFWVNSQINILWENVNAFVYQGKSALNLQVEIIWGIISIIILSSLIFLNRSIIILFLLNLALVGFDSVFTFDFFVQYNLVYFDFVRASNS